MTRKSNLSHPVASTAVGCSGSTVVYKVVVAAPFVLGPCFTLCPFWFCNPLVGEERVGCFTFSECHIPVIVLVFSSRCHGFVCFM